MIQHNFLIRLIPWNLSLRQNEFSELCGTSILPDMIRMELTLSILVKYTSC